MPVLFGRRNFESSGHRQPSHVSLRIRRGSDVDAAFGGWVEACERGCGEWESVCDCAVSLLGLAHHSPSRRTDYAAALLLAS